MGQGHILRRGGGDAELEGITIITPPNKTGYIAGETFNPAGMVVRADIGGTQIEIGSYDITPSGPLTGGTTKITISYEFGGVTKTADQAITVKTLSSIAISTQPTKRAYTFGETFDPAGMAVRATYSDGSTAIVTGWTYTPTGVLIHSDTTVTVSYSVGGTTKTATTTITIAKVLTGISITSAPTTTTYITGQTITTAGMVVTATYSDGSTANVTAQCATSPATATTGTTAFTVSYTYNGVTKTAQQSISTFTPSTTFAENTEAQIELVAAAGMASQFWNVGASRQMSLNGTNYEVVIIGFNHDDLDPTDARYGTGYNNGSNKAAITLQLRHCYNTTYPMNSSDTNAGGWASCSGRTSVMQTMKGYMPDGMESILRTVKKKTSAGSASATIVDTADELFLLSEIEIFGALTYSAAGEGLQYAYYSAGNSKVKNVSGSASFWWERSPNASNSTNFCRVYNNGVASSHGASYPRGIAVGFCV